MQRLEILFNIFEFITILLVLVMLRDHILYTRINVRRGFFLMILLTSMCISSALGGIDAFLFVLKVLSFCFLVWFSLKFAKRARCIVVVFMLFEVISRFYDLGGFSKHAFVHFFLFGCLFFVGQDGLSRMKKFFLLIFFSLEIIQATLLGSRASMLFIFMAFCILMLGRMLSHKQLRGCVIFGAIAAPPVYFFLMYIVHHSIVSGYDVVRLTPSNMERSAMIAWCIDHLSSFILTGPGTQFFDAMRIYGPQVRDFQTNVVDPHSFLLVAWMWLGLAPVLFLYYMWCKLFMAIRRFNPGKLNFKGKYFAIIISYAVVLFITTPPDASSRLKVALLLGVGIAGLRDCNVFNRREVGNKVVSFWSYGKDKFRGDVLYSHKHIL